MIKQHFMSKHYRHPNFIKHGRIRILRLVQPWSYHTIQSYQRWSSGSFNPSCSKLSRLGIVSNHRLRRHDWFLLKANVRPFSSIPDGADGTFSASQATSSSDKNPDHPEEKKAKEKQKEQAKKGLSKAGELKRWKYLNPVFLGKKAVSCFQVLVSFFNNPREILPKLAALWRHFKHECKHYWNGFKLLWVDIKCMFPLMKKVVQGGKLTWRERTQLKRTSFDCLRIVPFSLFIIIPALELLLPVALFLFPNMLPSTFEKKSEAERRRKQKLAVRLELATFVEEMLSDYVKIMQKKDKDHAEYIPHAKLIVTSMRNQQPVSTATIMKVAKLFDDHITIDNMNRQELETLCRFMFIGGVSYSTDEMLRRSLIDKMKTICRDDRLIKEEGVNSLNVYEVNQALFERGMRGDSNLEYARARLAKWISLSQDQSVPISLLILSRAFNIRLSKESTEEAQEKAKKLEKSEENLIAQVLSKEISDLAVDMMLVEKAGVFDSEAEANVLKRQKQLIEEAAEHEKKIETKTKPVPTEVEVKEKAVESKLADIISKLEPEEITAKGLRDPTFVEEFFKPALEEKDNKDKVTKIKLSQESLDKEIHERQKKEFDDQNLLKSSPDEVTELEMEVNPGKVEDDVAEEIGVDGELRELQAEVIEYWKDNVKVTKLSKRVGKMIKKLEKQIEKKDELNDDELMAQVQELYEKEKAKEVQA